MSSYQYLLTTEPKFVTKVIFFGNYILVVTNGFIINHFGNDIHVGVQNNELAYVTANSLFSLCLPECDNVFLLRILFPSLRCTAYFRFPSSSS